MTYNIELEALPETLEGDEQAALEANDLIEPPVPELPIQGRMEVSDDGVAIQVYDCDEPGCYRTFTTSQGLQMHRQRVHVSDEKKAEWARNRSRISRATAQVKRDAKALPPEVQAILERTLEKGTAEYEARRKRLRSAKSHGHSDAVFMEHEVQRARRMAAEGIPTTSGTKERPSKVKVNAVAKTFVDDMFVRVAAATKALVDADDLFTHFEEVAEIRQQMFTFLNRLKG